MVIFNSYFDITRGYLYWIGTILSLGEFNNKHGNGMGNLLGRW
jgi:hypothetical protein